MHTHLLALTALVSLGTGALAQSFSLSGEILPRGSANPDPSGLPADDNVEQVATLDMLPTDPELAAIELSLESEAGDAGHELLQLARGEKPETLDLSPVAMPAAAFPMVPVPRPDTMVFALALIATLYTLRAREAHR